MAGHMLSLPFELCITSSLICMLVLIIGMQCFVCALCTVAHIMPPLSLPVMNLLAK